MTEEVPAVYSPTPNGIEGCIVKRRKEKLVTGDISAGEEILKEKLVGEKDKADRLAYVVPLIKERLPLP